MRGMTSLLKIEEVFLICKTERTIPMRIVPIRELGRISGKGQSYTPGRDWIESAADISISKVLSKYRRINQYRFIS